MEKKEFSGKQKLNGIKIPENEKAYKIEADGSRF
jgi:hypothetical protein